MLVMLFVLCTSVFGSNEVRQPQGLLEATAARAQESLQSLWVGARAQAEDAVQGLVKTLHRQEHDVLSSATAQFDKLGVELDLNELGDQVNDDVYSCAKAMQAEYTKLLGQLRRRMERCWGWESREVTALVRSIEDLIYAGDRLPALLRANMDQCLQKGRPAKTKAKTVTAGREADAVTPSPSPFRVLRCTADSVNLTWTYVTSVPREVGRATRRAATILGSSREDWLACARHVLSQSKSPAVQPVRDLAMCVLDAVSEHSWRRLHAAWEKPS